RFARAGLGVTEIPAHEPARIGGKRKMMPFRTGWQITLLILRDFFTFWPARPAAGTQSDDIHIPGASMSTAREQKPFKLLQRCKVCGSSELTDVISIAPQFLSPTFTPENREEGELAGIRVPLTPKPCDQARNTTG